MTNAAQNDGDVGQYLRTIFETIPLPTFVVNSDVQIQDYNAAAALLLGSEPEAVLQRRGGEALHCVNAEAHGCGRSETCRRCVVRNSVGAALSGNATHRETHRVELRSQGKTVGVDLLVSATPLAIKGNPRVLLILEDISELLALRGLLPICCHCKKVRDDQQYWHSIDTYLHTHMNVQLTHGLCPKCLEAQMHAVDAFGAPRS